MAQTPNLSKTIMFRSKAYREGGRDLACIRCGAEDGTVVGAHYCGKYANRLGRGAGMKAHDLVADFCAACHTEFDTYRLHNSDDRAAEFMLCIVLTMVRRIEQGIVVVKG